MTVIKFPMALWYQFYDDIQHMSYTHITWCMLRHNDVITIIRYSADISCNRWTKLLLVFMHHIQYDFVFCVINWDLGDGIDGSHYTSLTTSFIKTKIVHYLTIQKLLYIYQKGALSPRIRRTAHIILSD